MVAQASRREAPPGSAVGDAVRSPANLMHGIMPTDVEVARARRRLRAKAVVIGAGALAGYWGLVVADTGLLVRMLSAAVLILAATSMATGVMHDANHGAFSRSTRVNRCWATPSTCSAGARGCGASSTTCCTTRTPTWSASTATSTRRRSPVWPPSSRGGAGTATSTSTCGSCTGSWRCAGSCSPTSSTSPGTASGRSRSSCRRRRRDVALMAAGKLIHLGWAVLIPMALHPWWGVRRLLPGLLLGGRLPAGDDLPDGALRRHRRVRARRDAAPRAELPAPPTADHGRHPLPRPRRALVRPLDDGRSRLPDRAPHGPRPAAHDLPAARQAAGERVRGPRAALSLPREHLGRA